MEPTLILSSEHRVIEVVLDCLERLTGQAQAASRLDRESAETVVDFIRSFADGCHHGKEENHLFPALVRKGVPGESGPVGVMLHEHEEGRAYVRAMAEQIPAAAEGDKDAVAAFSINAFRYIELLRAHIKKEDGVLFPMAERILSKEDRRRLREDFENVEIEEIGEGVHEDYLAVARRLAKKFDVSIEDIANANCSCGH